MRALLSSLFVLSVCITLAQEASEAIVTQQLVDDLLTDLDPSASHEEVLENLVLIANDRVDINKASAEDLRHLKFLSEYHIQSIIQHRTDNGDFLSLYELQAVPALDAITLGRLLPFVTLHEQSTQINRNLLDRIVREKNNYFLIRYERTLEDPEGLLTADPERRFTGSPDKWYVRFRTSRADDFSFGFTLEKDAGEQIIWQPGKQYGFDFLSGHAQVKNKGRLTNLVVGDYLLQAGQGLVLGGMFGLGKGGETITAIRKSTLGAAPYTSSGENTYLRGMTATTKIGQHFFITGYVSNTQRDGSLTLDSLDVVSIRAFQTTGLHRNRTELANRRALREIQYGGFAHFKRHQLEGGLVWNTTTFEAPLNQQASAYNQFRFTGTQSHNMSFYVNYNIHNIAMFSEVAKSHNGGAGIIIGMLGSLSPRFDIALLYRNYAKDFHSINSNSLAESSTPQNERGVYAGWKYHISKNYSLCGYIDFFRFPWLRYRLYAPSSGHEWLLRAQGKLSRNIIAYAQYKEEHKSRNTPDNASSLYHTFPGIKRSYLANVQINASRTLQLRTRLQHSTYGFDKTHSSGLAVIQDVRFSFRSWSLSARHAIFDTDDYDNRQYVYENDAWLSFTFPAYYGVGIRNYVMIEYQLNKHVTFWARYARTRYTDRDSIGSGLDRIEGNTKNDIKFQVKLRI